jgi:hypothetical protein
VKLRTSMIAGFLASLLALGVVACDEGALEDDPLDDGGIEDGTDDDL